MTSEYLTLVFRNPADAKALIARDDCRAMSWSHALRELDKAEDQRDELAKALSACVDNYYNCGGDEQSCARAGREALAKLDGGS